MDEVTIQIFGTAKSQETKKAQRFFKERGLTPHFVDLKVRAIAPGELKRFVTRHGLSALLDTSGRAYERSNLAYMRVSDEQLMERMIDEPELMRQPLVRAGTALEVGWNEAFWRDWYAAQR
jgi:arsenate reductase (glutaredoxin)